MRPSLHLGARFSDLAFFLFDDSFLFADIQKGLQLLFIGGGAVFRFLLRLCRRLRLTLKGAQRPVKRVGNCAKQRP